MPTILQFRRGTTAQNNVLTGAVGELSIDTDLDTIRVHDGSTAGGFELVQKNATQTLTNKTINLANNTLTMTSAQLAAALTDETGSGANVFATSPTLVTPNIGTPSAGTLTNCTGLPISTGVSGLGTGVATALAVAVGSAGAPVTFNGALGTPSSGTLTNATGLPISTGVSGLGTGVATFLATPSSANLISAITDETGSGSLVFATAPTLTRATENNMFLVGAREKVTVSATAATGTIAFDYLTQAVLYYTTNASANWVINIRGDGSNTLNSVMAVGDAITVAFIVPQGGTAYYNTSVQIDGTTSGVTTTWQGGAPTKGNASGQDHYTYTIIKTAASTYTVFAAQTQFKA